MLGATGKEIGVGVGAIWPGKISGRLGASGVGFVGRAGSNPRARREAINGFSENVAGTVPLTDVGTEWGCGAEGGGGVAFRWLVVTLRRLANVFGFKRACRFGWG